MKKQLLILALAGLFISPLAAHINDQDLQKMAGNKMENKALQTAQYLVGFFATTALFVTGGSAVITAQACYENQPVAGCLSALTALTGAATIGLWAGWYQIFKKRAERHGYKDDKLKFFFIDMMANSVATAQAMR